jgi:hypothetical protein
MFAVGALMIAIAGILIIGIIPSTLFQAAGNAAQMMLQ